MKAEKQEFKQLSNQELKEKLDALRRDLFGLKLNASTAHIKDYSQIGKISKHIAQVLTLLRQSEQQISNNK